jgi:hypothetical protein
MAHPIAGLRQETVGQDARGVGPDGGWVLSSDRSPWGTAWWTLARATRSGANRYVAARTSSSGTKWRPPAVASLVPAAEVEAAADEEAEDEEETTAGRNPAGGGVTVDDLAGAAAGDGAVAEVTAAVPRTARFGPINRAARLKTLRVAVS